MHNTRHRINSNFNIPLFNHSKTQKCYLCEVISIGNSLQNSLKNCTFKFTFKKQIKSHLLAYQSQQRLNYQCKWFQINYRCMFSYLVFLLIFEFFPVRLTMLPCRLDSNVTQLCTSQPVNQAICILLFCQLYLVFLFQ